MPICISKMCRASSYRASYSSHDAEIVRRKAGEVKSIEGLLGTTHLEVCPAPTTRRRYIGVGDSGTTLEPYPCSTTFELQLIQNYSGTAFNNNSAGKESEGLGHDCDQEKHITVVVSESK